MASETITVCENICRDFSWLPELMSVLGNFGTFLVGIGAIAAFRQLSVWKSQAKSLSEAEVAKAVLVAVYEVDEALRFIRNPFDRIPIEKSKEKGITYIRRNERIIQTNEAFEKLRKAQINHDIVLGISEVSHAIDELFSIRSDIRLAIEFLYEVLDEPKHDAETRQMMKEWRSKMSGSYSERDDLGIQQVAAVEKIKNALSDIARLRK